MTSNWKPEGYYWDKDIRVIVYLEENVNRNHQSAYCKISYNRWYDQDDILCYDPEVLKDLLPLTRLVRIYYEL